MALLQNAKYDKRVLLLCTTVKHMRLFVVKVYGAECNYMCEADVLKVLGQHPNVCELLAVTTLKSESIMRSYNTYSELIIK